jgi:hypothetical protein
LTSQCSTRHRRRQASAPGADSNISSSGGGGSGFTIDHVVFRDMFSTSTKGSGSFKDYYTGDFFCTKDQPCRDITLQNIHFAGDDVTVGSAGNVSSWKCNGGTGCGCFTSSTGFDVKDVTPDISQCF